jgi:hypothetical protein
MKRYNRRFSVPNRNRFISIDTGSQFHAVLLGFGAERNKGRNSDLYRFRTEQQKMGG